MEFRINGTKWTIKLVSESVMAAEEHNDYTLGLTIYKPQEIWLVETQPSLIRTLKHELMHVWLYENAHRQDEDSKYDCEDICEIVASSNNFVNKIVKEYMKKYGWIKNES